MAEKKRYYETSLEQRRKDQAAARQAEQLRQKCSQPAWTRPGKK